MPQETIPSIVILDTKIVRASSYDIEHIGHVLARLRDRGLSISGKELVARLDFLANENLVELVYFDKTPIHLPMVRRALFVPDTLLEIRTVVRYTHERRRKRA